MTDKPAQADATQPPCYCGSDAHEFGIAGCKYAQADATKRWTLCVNVDNEERGHTAAQCYIGHQKHETFRKVDVVPLAALEQAERERDEALKRNEQLEQANDEGVITTLIESMARAEQAEARALDMAGMLGDADRENAALERKLAVITAQRDEADTARGNHLLEIRHLKARLKEAVGLLREHHKPDSIWAAVELDTMTKAFLDRLDTTGHA